MRSRLLLACAFLLQICVCTGLSCFECNHFGSGTDVDCEDKKCEGSWCTAAIVRDRSTGTTSVHKSCARTHIGGDSTDSCLRVHMDSVESITCACQKGHLCNSLQGLQHLQKKHLIDFVQSKGAHISCPSCQHAAIGTDCDLKSQCNGEWCFAVIVRDRNTNTSTTSKGCSAKGPGLEQEYCSIAVGDDKIDTITCVCNGTNFCTGEASLQKLMKRTISFNKTHPKVIASASKNKIKERLIKSYNDDQIKQAENLKNMRKNNNELMNDEDGKAHVLDENDKSSKKKVPVSSLASIESELHSNQHVSRCSHNYIMDNIVIFMSVCLALIYIRQS